MSLWWLKEHFMHFFNTLVYIIAFLDFWIYIYNSPNSKWSNSFYFLLKCLKPKSAERLQYWKNNIKD